jgi:hypothetical protein
MHWNWLGQRENLAPAVGQNGSTRVRHGGEAVSALQRAAGLLHQRCARLAARIRSSTEPMGGDPRPAQRAARRVPWLGLLLWLFACAALFVSLVLRADDLDRDRRVAVRAGAAEQISDRSYSVPGLTGQASELGLFTVPAPPSP